MYNFMHIPFCVLQASLLLLDPDKNKTDGADDAFKIVSEAWGLLSDKGSRLTAFELVHDKIPATLIVDSTAAALMKTGRVHAAAVGADRVAAIANGDTAYTPETL